MKIPEMVKVPGGEFLYGDERIEKYLPTYQIGRHPVTNGQYLHFVEDTGGAWRSPVGRNLEYANHPATYVTWHDARAYCDWLSAKTGTLYRLPTEEEWEKAARGTDGRKYPWGEWDEGRCNTYDVGFGKTTPVGQFSPDGDSPYGLQDAAGNVWEWTDSWYSDKRVYRVVRGGSWFDYRDLARCAFRDRIVPVSFYSDGGFRVVS